MEKNLHTLQMCVLNCVAFALTTYLTIVTDPLLASRSRVYSTEYPFGYSILLFLVPVLVLTYYSNTKITNALKRSVGVGLSLILPSLASLPNFDPVFHEWNFPGSLMFAFVISCISFVHTHRLKLEFASDSKLHYRARIEKLKLEHENWFRMLSIFVVGIVSLSAFTTFRSVENFETFYSPVTTNEKTIVANTMMIRTSFLVVLMLVLVKEILEKMGHISRHLTRIKKEANQSLKKH